MIKVYFSAARIFSKELHNNYVEILAVLNDYGFDVFENTVNKKTKSTLEMTESEKIDNYLQIIKWIDRANFCVMEASFPSTLHIGHEITISLEKNKPTIVLYEKGKVPAQFMGLKNNKLIWVEYELGKVRDVLSQILNEIKNNVDVRFNFFIPNSLFIQFEKTSKDEGINKSELIRRLVEKDMKKNMRYKKI
jgi:hypothetical protein